jgi:hypothetical protein
MFFHFYSVGWWAGQRTLDISTEMEIVLHVKFLLCLSDFKQNWNGSNTFSQNEPILNFIKILSVILQSLHAHEYSDVDMSKEQLVGKVMDIWAWKSYVKCGIWQQCWWRLKSSGIRHHVNYKWTTQKMERASSSKKSVTIYQSTRRHIPGDLYLLK